MRIFLVIGCIFAFLAVAAGAFGAHALESRLDARLLEVFETAARYQIYHALALIATGLWLERRPDRWLKFAGWFFIAGILIFSGSLYILALTGIGWLGAITPIGGVCFLVGWASLARAAWQG